MDLPTIRTIVTPASRDALPPWTEGTGWLAGGTWLFSEPQPQLQSLVDLTSLGWPAFETADGHWRIAATCPIATLEAFAAPTHWTAAPLFGQCGQALSGSFKVRNVATVGGNLCLALPAAPMVALTVALDGVAWIWRPNGTDYRLPMCRFVLGPQRTALLPGEVLRAVDLPLPALQQRAALRQGSLTVHGRSAVLLIATWDRVTGCFALTMTASTVRPFVLSWPQPPTPSELDRRVADLPASVWLDDVHGRPAWRRHMTRVLADELLAELSP